MKTEINFVSNIRNFERSGWLIVNSRIIFLLNT